MERGSLMLNTTTFVGLDVHARSIKAVALDAMTGEVRSATFGYDAAEVAGWVSSVDPSAKCVYESAVTGARRMRRNRHIPPRGNPRRMKTHEVRTLCAKLKL